MPNIALMVAAIFAVLVSPVLSLIALGAPDVGEIALVISPPWGPSSHQIAEKAGVQEVAPERAPLGVLVSVDRADAVGRLYENGAWLVVDGNRILELCSD